MNPHIHASKKSAVPLLLRHKSAPPPATDTSGEGRVGSAGAGRGHSAPVHSWSACLFGRAAAGASPAVQAFAPLSFPPSGQRMER